MLLINKQAVLNKLKVNGNKQFYKDQVRVHVLLKHHLHQAGKTVLPRRFNTPSKLVIVVNNPSTLWMD